MIRGRKPLSLASDIFFVGLVAMLLFPSTRNLLLSGVASVRTWITKTGVSAGPPVSLSPEGWNWRLTDALGRETTFGSFRGEVIFLNQWATWCPPCRAEMPSIARLYRDYGDRIKFVMLTGEDPRKVRDFIDKQGYTFPVYFGSVAGASLSSRSIPSTAIISRSGEIMANMKGAYNWNARKIRKLIERLESEKLAE